MSVRLEVSISHSRPKNNVFNCQELLLKANPPPIDAELPPKLSVLETSAGDGGARMVDTDNDDDDDEDMEEGDAEARKKKGREEDYDVDDDFIDDSDMFYQDGSFMIPTKSNYGYFAWQGPVENFFEEYVPDVFESPKPSTSTTASAKKKKTPAASKSKKSDAKPTPGPSASSSSKEPQKETTATSSKDPSISQSDLPASEQPKPTTMSDPISKPETPVVNGDAKKRKKSPAKEEGEKKRRKPAEKKGVDQNGTVTIAAAGEAGKVREVSVASSSAPAPMQDVVVEIGGSDPGGERLDVKIEVAEGEKKKKKKKKENESTNQAYNSEIMQKLEILREQALNESFEVKRHFPPALKPLLFDAAWVAVSFNSLDLNFVKHLREFLPYNTFTLKKLTVKMLIREGIAILQKEMERMYPEIQGKIGELLASQGIDGPYEAPPPTILPPPVVVPEGSEDPTLPPPTESSSETPKKKFRWTEELRISYKRKVDRKSNVTSIDISASSVMQLVGPVAESPSLMTISNLLKAVRVFFPPDAAAATTPAAGEKKVVKKIDRSGAEVKAEGGDSGTVVVEMTTTECGAVAAGEAVGLSNGASSAVITACCPICDPLVLTNLAILPAVALDCLPPQPAEMETEYERERMENIRKNQELLLELGLADSSSQGLHSAKPAHPKKKRTKRDTVKPETNENSNNEGDKKRFSLRVRGLDPDGLAAKAFAEEAAIREQEYQNRRARIRGKIPLLESNTVLKSEEGDDQAASGTNTPKEKHDETANFLKTLQTAGISVSLKRKASSDDDTSDTAPTPTNHPNYKSLSIPIPEGTVKVTKEMIYTIAMHPSVDKLIAGVGDKTGAVAFWDVSDLLDRLATGPKEEEEVEPLVVSFKPHARPVSKIMYRPGDPNRILTSSYDGSIRCMEINAQMFDEVYVHPSEDIITSFDIDPVTGQTCWFSIGDGSVGTVDLRCPNKTSIPLYTLSEKKINTVHINPTISHLILTAGLDNTFNVFDVRKIQRSTKDSYEPVISLRHGKSVNSAFWSPQMGPKV
ncbi:WD repeat-containing protein 76 [Dinochytrium kinnereticum]|nr:WD repeat-containing protein 76 [Dinochytrium kinnereticum]